MNTNKDRGGHMPPIVAAACHAICQSGKFETGQGGCAAICLSMLGSSRGGPHGCAYAEQVHGELALSVLEAAAKATGQSSPSPRSQP